MRQRGVIQLIPILVVAALLVTVAIGTLSIDKITSFFNRAAENFVISSPPQISPGPSASPSSPEDWRACISTPGAKILQTYPAICVSPDGRRITEPTSQVPIPPSTETPLPNSAPGTFPIVSSANPSYGPPNSPFVIPTIPPNPTCAPMPPCVNSNPRCLIPEPAEGWCPATPTQVPQAAVSPVVTSIISAVINSIGSFLQSLFGR